MIRRIPRLSLANRLRLLVILAITAALLVAGLMYAAAEYYSLRRGAAERLLTQAIDLAQDASGPLRRADGKQARGLLTPQRADPLIRSERLYDAAGRVFADFSPWADAGAAAGAAQSAATDDAPRDRQSVRYVGLSRVRVAVPVMQGGERLGSVQLEADLTPLLLQAQRDSQYVLAGLLLAAVAAFLLTGRARRGISAPVHDLLLVTREVLERKNYSIRADKEKNDEIGALVDGFNAILTELERRDRHVHVYQNEFEKRVRERTVQLDIAVANAQEAAKRAEEASRAKSDFLARMSHEIRTPMNGVLGMAELLRHSPSLDARQRHYAVTIHQSGNALLEIINDILDFSKIEAGKLELDIGRFCLRDIVEDAIDIVAERAYSKGLELVCDIPPQIDTTVCGDGLRLRQVLINLISNAVKFTARGEVKIKVRNVDTGLHNSSFHFEVTDTGIGIQPENCAAIFESFAQEDSSTTRRYGGTGLGLAICQQLVELMGGKIGVRSTPGQGSTFYFSVPLEADATAVREPRSAAMHSTRMLIVDDHATSRSILRQHLSGWGVTVIEAESGPRALAIMDKALAGEFDVLIIDGEMPDMSGEELATAIRSRADFVGVPLVMMNAGHVVIPSATAAREGAMTPREGAIAWLSKPIRRTQLHACLTALLANPAQTGMGRAAAPRPAAAGPAQSGLRAARVRRVLLVEDNPVNQEVARAMLQELGVEVVSAWSGEEALEKLGADRYDVVLMDCQMPNLDGYMTTSRFRELEQEQRRARTLVVALTANALSGDAEKCFAAGMDRYLSKPFTIEQLLGVLESEAPEAVAPAAETKGENPILDPHTLRRIQALRRPGSPDLFARVVGLYTQNSHELIEAMRTAALQNDHAAMLQTAHALKSSSANVGATVLAALCKDIEAAVGEGRFEFACALVETLLAEHKIVLQALEQALGEQSIAA